MAQVLRIQRPWVGVAVLVVAIFLLLTSLTESQPAHGLRVQPELGGTFSSVPGPPEWFARDNPQTAPGGRPRQCAAGIHRDPRRDDLPGCNHSISSHQSPAQSPADGSVRAAQPVRSRPRFRGGIAANGTGTRAERPFQGT